MRTRYWATVALAGFAIYSAVAVLGTVSAATYLVNAHVPINWTSYVANRFLEQYTCALFVAPIFWLVERYPLFGMHWRRNALRVLAIMLVFVAIKYSILAPLYHLWTGHAGDSIPQLYVENIVPVLFDFMAIAGVAHALQYYRYGRERERAASELSVQLVQSRLDALRGQLHPHFLFNTLNAAATLMHDDVDAADQMLTQLGDLLRMSLARDSAEITLGEELQLADRYLAIMRHRFSDRLSVHCEADAGVRNAMVPTFFIQPLIENALEHGIARRRGPGRIQITARRDDARLVVVVADDGPGLEQHAKPGIGLSNTRARLKELYGTAQTFVLEAAPGGGAQAVVQIPYRECPAS
jgi:signal transduction histidine kinase